MSFEVAHDSLRRRLRFDHRVHMIASHMGCQQSPSTMQTHLVNRFQDSISTDLVQVIGILIHTFPLRSGACAIHFQNRGSRGIVIAVDGAGFAALQVASIAGEGDQVSHRL